MRPALALNLMLAAMIAAGIAACALAIPVRVEPMTLHKPDAAGNQPLTPDTPEPGPVVAGFFASLLTVFGGPLGTTGAALVTALLGAGTYSAGRRHGHAKARKLSTGPPVA